MYGAIASAAAGAIGGIGSALNGLFTSDDERLTHKEVLARIEQAPHLAQLRLTSIEAGHRNIFVAGWRPAVGWVCALALFYSFILRDLIVWAMAIWADTVQPPPAIAMEYLSTILLGMLGLGGYRSFEKVKGISR